MRIVARIVVGLGLLYYLGIFFVVVGLSRELPLTREFVFAGVAIVLLGVMSVGLRRAASQRTQRIALVASALWFLYGSVTLLGTWPPEDVLPFVVLFVLPTALVGYVLLGGIGRGRGAD
jgi:hypothetical protein